MNAIMNIVLLIILLIIGVCYIQLKGDLRSVSQRKESAEQALADKTAENAKEVSKLAEERKRFLDQIAQGNAKLEHLAGIQNQLTLVQHENASLKTALEAIDAEHARMVAEAAAAELAAAKPFTLPKGASLVSITAYVDNSEGVAAQIAAEESRIPDLQRRWDVAKDRLNAMREAKVSEQDPFDRNKRRWTNRFSANEIERAAADVTKFGAELRAVNGKLIALCKERSVQHVTGKLQDGKPVEIFAEGAAAVVAAREMQVGQTYAIEGAVKREGPRTIIQFVAATPVK